MSSTTSNDTRILRSQRWRERRARFVDGQSVIDPREYAVDVVSFTEAKRFVERHHYTASMPATRLAIGLHRNGPAGRSELAAAD